MASHRENETLLAGPVPPPQTIAAGDHPAAEPFSGNLPARPAYGSLWLALRRRWLLAFTVGLVLGGAAAAAGWFLRPAKYTAFAFVKIDTERLDLLPRDRAASDLELYRMSQTALIKSPKVLEAALRQDKVRQLSLVAEESDPITWLENALGVEPLRNTDLLRVSLSAPNAAEAADLVNAVVHAYLQEVVNREQKQRVERLKDLKEVCEKSEDNLRRRRKRLQGVAESLKANDHETTALRQKIALEEYVALRKELIALGSEFRQITRNRGGEIREASVEGAVLSDVAVDQALDTHPDVVVQTKKVTEAKEALSLLKATAVPGYSGIPAAEEKLAAAKAAMDALRARLRRGVEAKFQQRLEAAGQQANAKRAEREALLKEQFDAVSKEVEERRTAADQIGLAAILYETERSEIEQADKIIKSLWAERERLEVESRSNAQRITVEVDAATPRSKNRKPQFLVAGVAGFMCFFTGAFGVAFLDCRARRIYSRDEVVQGLRLRVLGALPVLMAQPPASPGRQLKYAYWWHQWKEALTGLRTVLLHEANQHGLQVVQVTSAAPQEGKTTLASHLAMSIAAAGRRTLLIDADLRRPVLHNTFAVPQTPGLSEALREECTAAAAIKPTSLPGLSLLPAGSCNDAVLHLLAQGRLEELLRLLRSGYDAIVIDSSPIMAVNDALLIGHHVDAVLLSIRPSRSRVPVVQEACERLQSLDIPVLGTVLNGLLDSRRDLMDRYVSSPAAPPATLPTGNSHRLQSRQGTSMHRVNEQTRGVRIIAFARILPDRNHDKTEQNTPSELANSEGTVIVDLGSVVSLDPDRLSALLRFIADVYACGGEVGLAALSRKVRFQAQQMQLHRIVDIFNTVEEALRSRTLPAHPSAAGRPATHHCL